MTTKTTTNPSPERTKRMIMVMGREYFSLIKNNRRYEKHRGFYVKFLEVRKIRQKKKNHMLIDVGKSLVDVSSRAQFSSSIDPKILPPGEDFDPSPEDSEDNSDLKFIQEVAKKWMAYLMTEKEYDLVGNVNVNRKEGNTSYPKTLKLKPD